MNIRIIIADNHQIVRDGLRCLFSRISDVDVVGDAQDGRGVLRIVKEVPVDVIVMEIFMPNLNGIEATRQLIADYPDVKVVALSMHTDRRYILEMLKAGASGYLLKDSAFEELIAAIRAVSKGQKYLSPQIAGVLVEEFIGGPKSVSPIFANLTGRECEVFQLLAEGNTTREIASVLHVSVKTVETHRQRVMKKLNLKSIAELTRLAIREGMVSLD